MSIVAPTIKIPQIEIRPRWELLSLVDRAFEWLDENSGVSFASVMFEMGIPILSDKIATAAVRPLSNGKIELVFSPAFLSWLHDNSYAPNQAVATVLAHEALHIFLDHSRRGKGKDHNTWSIATDVAINYMLEKWRIRDRALEELQPATYQNLNIPESIAEGTAEDIYTYLKNLGQAAPKGKTLDQHSSSSSGSGSSGNGKQSNKKSDSGQGQGQGQQNKKEDKKEDKQEDKQDPKKDKQQDNNNKQSQPQNDQHDNSQPGQGEQKEDKQDQKPQPKQEGEGDRPEPEKEDKDDPEQESEQEQESDPEQDALDEIKQMMEELISGDSKAGNKVESMMQRFASPGDKAVGELRKFQSNIAKYKVSWEKLLAQRIATEYRDFEVANWMPARKIRTFYPDVLLPSDQDDYEKKKYDIMVAIDASGSMGFEQLKVVKEIISTLPQDKIRVTPISFDTRAYEMESLDSDPRGGGGTWFQCIEDYLQSRFKPKRHKHPDLVLVLTDGYASRIKPECPGRWVWILVGYAADDSSVKGTGQVLWSSQIMSRV